ncbi:MAG: YbbR-like domain-containing protein [Prevotella sp.]|nr:YbbR-like domain-containing protein [Prevotella sp.]
MRGSRKDVNKTLRNFFLWIKSKEFLVFLFFLLVSGLFWVVLAVKEPAEKEIELLFTVTNQPSNVVITSEKVDTIKVIVRDNGYNLIGYLFERPEPIQIKFASYAKDDGKISVNNAELIKLVRKRLERSAEIVAIKPERLELYFNYGDNKVVPVALDADIKAADKYFITLKRLEPDTVKIYASKDILASIDSAKTRYTRITNISGETTYHVALKKINGVKYEPAQVTLHVNADLQRDVTLDVPVEMVNVPDSVLLRVFPSKVRVSFVTGTSLVDNISAEDFRVEVDYNDVEQNTDQKTLPLKLVTSPSMAKRPKMETTKVDYLIEKL